MKMISESPVESRSLLFFPGKQDILRGDLVKDKNKIDEKFDAKCTSMKQLNFLFINTDTIQ